MIPYETLIMEILPGETPQEKYENLREMGSIIFDAGWVPGWTKQDITIMIKSKFSLERIEILSGRKE